MSIVHTRAKKWGDSIAIIIPSALVNEKQIKAGDKLSISVSKSHDLREIFGVLKRESR